MGKPYDYRNCLSLFGYAKEVHERSGGICQYCGYGSGMEVSFDLWRQLTVEHIIGESGGGYPRELRATIARLFPTLTYMEQMRVLEEINKANTVTACSFCNSMTSRDALPSMEELLRQASEGGIDVEIISVTIAGMLEVILDMKRQRVLEKLEAVQKAFYEQVEPRLRAVPQRVSIPEKM